MFDSSFFREEACVDGLQGGVVASQLGHFRFSRGDLIDLLLQFRRPCAKGLFIRLVGERHGDRFAPTAPADPLGAWPAPAACGDTRRPTRHRYRLAQRFGVELLLQVANQAAHSRNIGIVRFVAKLQ